MLELLLCSMLTILPDYLYRRLVQGKRLGKEITFFSVWFELRWGIVVLPDAHDFAHHPDLLFPPVDQLGDPVLPDGPDPARSARDASPRCSLDFSAPVAKGDVIFKLDSSKQEAAAETARRKIAEIDAALIAAQADVVKAEGQVQEAKSALQQAQDELDVKSELQRRNPGIVPQRDIEKLQVLVDGRQGSLDCRQRRQAVHGVAGFDPSAGREGERAGRTGRRPRSILTKPSFVPALAGAWSSSPCGSATSSIR